MGSQQSKADLPPVRTTGARKARATISDHDKSLLNLKIQRDKLIQQEKRLNNLIISEAALVQKILKEDENPHMKEILRGRAKVILISRKRHIEFLTKISQQRNNLEQLTESIEDSKQQVDILAALEKGNAVLKELHDGPLNIDRVVSIMDSVSDEIQNSKDVSEILAGSNGISNYDDILSDEDLLKELDQLISEKPVEIIFDKPNKQQSLEDRLKVAPSVPFNKLSENLEDKEETEHEEPIAA